MKFVVAIRDCNTTTQFSFDSREEREQFITKLKEQRPKAEFVRSEVEVELNRTAFFYPTSLSA